MVEIVSGVTGRRDYGPKREFYVDLGIAEYWIVDGRARSIRVVRQNADDIVSDFLSWHPIGAMEPLQLDVAAMFTEALGSY